jgi:hypothetical protein
MRFSFKDLLMLEAPSGSTPMHFVSGDNYESISDIPAASPPPPTGIKQ